jgi:hypothetical protein
MEPLRQSIGDKLFERMASLYGYHWASQYGGAFSGIAADTWASALSGITPQQIADGLRACVTEGDKWPPAAPRFRAMCLGIPSFAAVKLESTKATAQRSRFTLAVWMHVDGYAHRMASLRDADKILQDAYDIAREQVMRGVALPAKPVALIAEEEKPKPVFPKTREEAARHLRSILGDEYNPETAGLPDSHPTMTELRNPPSTDEE